jgi:hypothetical protein
MRLAERQRNRVEAHFTEGELDLEPPEEMAIGELDEEAILEEELDNEDLLEQDVDEDTLEESLDDLVHAGDEVESGDADSEFEGNEVEGQELEESLDLVLLDRLALLDDGEGADDEEDEGDGAAAVVLTVLAQVQADTIDLVEVTPRREDEFVCRSCFLVRKRVQLVDIAAMACHDCST